MRQNKLCNHCFRVFLIFISEILILKAQPAVQTLDTTHFHKGAGVILAKTSFRGMSIPTDKVVWISGSRGTIARSTDGGVTFTLNQIPGYENSDFRDVHAWDQNKAVVMSSGCPAVILQTQNGGQTWNEVYRNNDSAYFLDALDFWDRKKGVIIGDPVRGHFVILMTRNGGKTWKQLERSLTPHASEGEALFAASGTSMRVVGSYGTMGFVTGGKHARMLTVNLARKTPVWQEYALDIIHGESGQGAFSFAYNDSGLVVVGGDYKNPSEVKKYSNIQYLPASDERVYFEVPVTDVSGYRSCVEPLDPARFISCGTSGVDLYENRKWQSLSREGFHVVQKSRTGRAVFLAGPKGIIGKLIW